MIDGEKEWWQAQKNVKHPAGFFPCSMYLDYGAEMAERTGSLA